MNDSHRSLPSAVSEYMTDCHGATPAKIIDAVNLDEKFREHDSDKRERCPKCGALLYHESTDPLEEYCINDPCDYYRAEVGSGEVVRE